jgi:hypothetical protein
MRFVICHMDSGGLRDVSIPMRRYAVVPRWHRYAVSAIGIGDRHGDVREILDDRPGGPDPDVHAGTGDWSNPGILDVTLEREASG